MTPLRQRRFRSGWTAAKRKWLGGWIGRGSASSAFGSFGQFDRGRERAPRAPGQPTNLTAKEGAGEPGSYSSQLSVLSRLRCRAPRRRSRTWTDGQTNSPWPEARQPGSY
jgi:hypothetical protein